MAEVAKLGQFEKGMRDLDAPARQAGQGWIAAALLGVMLLSAAGSVSAANWAEGTGLTLWAMLAGLSFAALVARLKLRGWLAHPLMLLEGAFITALLSSSLVQPAWATWNEKLIIMEMRLGRWVGAVFSGGIGTDTLLFVMLLVALAWLIGYLAGWSVFHLQEPWGAILPLGIALLINLFYAPSQSGLYLMAFLLSALLLLVRTTLVKREQAWRLYSVRYAKDIGFDFLTYGVVFSGLVLLASWLIPPSAPSPTWAAAITDQVRGPWQDVSDNVGRMFSTVRNGNSSTPITLFGSSLAMGGPIRLGNRDVMDIEAKQGRYWRTVAFDRYTGTGWVTTANQTETFSGDVGMQVPQVALSRAITQTVHILLPGDNLIVAASEPVMASVPVAARFHILQGQSYLDIASLRSQRAFSTGDVYVVVSHVSGADEEALRSAPNSIPDDIRSLYLQLPNTVPMRLRDLAIALTEGSTTIYDKARAIEVYLRVKIKYDDSVSPPPQDRDAVDYTLFDRPAGYCNYYASAMVVLAREIGIPARVVSGYSRDESDQGVYHLNEGDAHTWPELYFGSLGWIAFEPTASKPEIKRPVNIGDTTDAIPSVPDFGDGSNLNKPPLTGVDDKVNNSGPMLFGIELPAGIMAYAGFGLVGFLFAALAVIAVLQLTWARRMRMLPAGARAWEETHRFARWLGLEPASGATPLERAAELKRALPDAGTKISEVTTFYIRERYGAHSLSDEEVGRAQMIGKALRNRVLRGLVDRAWTLGPLRLYVLTKKYAENLARILTRDPSRR